MASLVLPAVGAVFAADFKIVRPLREGGMGAVYVAEQLSTGAQRALKLMHPQYVDSATLRKRFEQEARLGARIESDYIVNVIGAGVDEASGMPWLAMELLQGEDLAERIARSGPMSVEETVAVFRPLCHAVGAAHAAGVVHRDLKPENIYLAKSRRPDEPFTVKVLDFGIARVTSEAKTKATGAVGTPLWMSPEQTVVGGAIAPPTDVWALGLIAFYVLTGKHYWRAAHEEEASLPVLLRELAIEPLEPASVRAAQLDVAAKIPPGFDAWFGRCVVRAPEERFRDANEAYRSLAPVLGAVAPHAAFAATTPVPEGSDAPKNVAARPFFVGTEAAAGNVASPLAAKLPPIATAPGTASTSPEATPPASGRARWIGIGAIVVLAGAAGFGVSRWAPWKTPAATTASVSPAAHTAATAAASTPSAQPTHSAVADTIAKDVEDRSPMVLFPGATFNVGSDKGAVDERPVHLVSFPAYYLQKLEVTAEDYALCERAGKCTPRGKDKFCNPEHKKRHPANCASFAQASAYCAWLGRRLPTEDEWESAAGGKDKRLYAWGNAAPEGRVCWGRCATNEGTCVAGSFPTGDTPEGLKDMTGNVWEWTASPYCPYEKLDCPIAQRVARGGGWCGSDATVMRTTVRQGYAPEEKSANVGFRCAKSL